MDLFNETPAGREAFFQAANESYARLREDAALWQEELEERRAWDATLMTDLEGDDYPI